jgi:DNA invertase Pin-like site-specific DNA recombinase
MNRAELAPPTSTPPAGTPLPSRDDSPCSLSAKVKPSHLARQAIVYVRQSTPQQVLNNRESTARQYALDRRAVQLGWPAASVVVVDEDQGLSGRTADGRTGFAYLLGQVALNRVGIILGLETSRLARSNKDWHQLLDLCAIFQTLLADQDGVYDPTQYNDRLLLGLLSSMS